MYISVNRDLLILCAKYTVAAVLAALFGAVYEHFSHEVYSYYMIYAFAIPLVFGTLPTLCLAFVRNPFAHHSLGLRIGGYAVAVLTVGSIVKGVLDIYGTTNKLSVWYLYIGLGLLAISAVILLIDLQKKPMPGPRQPQPPQQAYQQ